MGHRAGTEAREGVENQDIGKMKLSRFVLLSSTLSDFTLKCQSITTGLVQDEEIEFECV